MDYNRLSKYYLRLLGVLTLAAVPLSFYMPDQIINGLGGKGLSSQSHQLLHNFMYLVAGGLPGVSGLILSASRLPQKYRLPFIFSLLALCGTFPANMYYHYRAGHTGLSIPVLAGSGGVLGLGLLVLFSRCCCYHPNSRVTLQREDSEDGV